MSALRLRRISSSTSRATTSYRLTSIVPQSVRFDRAWKCFCRNFGTTASDLLVTPSKSGGEKQHIRVFLPFNVEPVERIALQAALGSDGVRELLSLRRVRGDDPHPTLFAETPEMMKTIRRDPQNGDDIAF